MEFYLFHPVFCFISFSISVRFSLFLPIPLDLYFSRYFFCGVSVTEEDAKLFPSAVWIKQLTLHLWAQWECWLKARPFFVWGYVYVCVLLCISECVRMTEAGAEFRWGKGAVKHYFTTSSRIGSAGDWVFKLREQCGRAKVSLSVVLQFHSDVKRVVVLFFFTFETFCYRQVNNMLYHWGKQNNPSFLYSCVNKIMMHLCSLLNTISGLKKIYHRGLQKYFWNLVMIQPPSLIHFIRILRDRINQSNSYLLS